MRRTIGAGIGARLWRLAGARGRGAGTGKVSRGRAGEARFGGLTLMACCLAALIAPDTRAAGLNDTGIRDCGEAAAGNNSPCTGNEPAGQDARYGRDVAAARGALPKVGGGEAGFDFSKIANNGSVLPASASLGSGAGDWACTRDNVTGLTWEVKTSDGGLRDQRWTYTWYDSVHNYGGNPGVASGGTCKTSGRCDTEKYVADVKATGLCGYSDWRMPTRRELQSIVHYGRFNPSIDPGYFPNTPSSSFWSGSPNASDSYYAWYVNFDSGYASYYFFYPFRDYEFVSVRLVRGGQ